MTTPLRERRRQMLREEILQHAMNLLCEKGYAAMSMDELAERVGISKPTLYSHFETKEDLVSRSAVHHIDKMLSAVDEMPAAFTPLERLTYLLRSAIRQQMEVHASSVGPRPWQPEMVAILHSNPDFAERKQRMDGLVSGYILEALAQGEIDPAFDPSTVARAFVSLMFAPGLMHKSGVLNPPNPENMAETLATIFQRGVSCTSHL